MNGLAEPCSWRGVDRVAGAGDGAVCDSERIGGGQTDYRAVNFLAEPFSPSRCGHVGRWAQSRTATAISPTQPSPVHIEHSGPSISRPSRSTISRRSDGRGSRSRHRRPRRLWRPMSGETRIFLAGALFFANLEHANASSKPNRRGTVETATATFSIAGEKGISRHLSGRCSGGPFLKRVPWPLCESATGVNWRHSTFRKAVSQALAECQITYDVNGIEKSACSDERHHVFTKGPVGCVRSAYGAAARGVECARARTT